MGVRITDMFGAWVPRVFHRWHGQAESAEIARLMAQGALVAHTRLLPKSDDVSSGRCTANKTIHCTVLNHDLIEAAFVP